MNTTRTKSRSAAERGSIMVLVMTILAALLAGGAIALYLQLSSTRSAGSVRESRSALYCAEAGLQFARPLVGRDYALWNAMLAGDPDDSLANYPYVGDLDGDGVNDFEVTIRDNDDEPPGMEDPTRDNDLRVFVISRCTKYPNTPRSVLELVRYEGGGNTYRNQAGQGAGNTGNAN